MIDNKQQVSVGCLIARVISANTTNATSVKASAGLVKGLQVANINAAARYLKLYNKASAPTVGTDVPVITILLQASSVPYNIVLPNNGLRFSTGIALAITAALADSDTTAVAANEQIVNLFYL